MMDRLFRALIASKNAAADDVLVDALRVGTPAEQTVVLGAMLARKNVRSLVGALGLYEGLPARVQAEIVANVRVFHGAICDAGRSSNPQQRRGAIALVAAGRQGRLAYVLGESLRGGDEGLARSAAAALVSLARWIGQATRALQRRTLPDDELDIADLPPEIELYRELIDNRPEIERTIVRGLELHHGGVGQELLTAALYLCDHAQSLTFQAARSMARGPTLRRIQQSPDVASVPAFLLSAMHGPLRAHLPAAFARVDAPSVLAAVAGQSHWLADNALATCAKQLTTGVWFDEATLAAEIARGGSRGAVEIARWIGASGLSEPQQDARLAQLLVACGNDPAARVSILRIACRRPRGAMTSVALIKQCLRDSDERIARLAARDLVRRRLPELETTLLPLMADAPESVRRIVGRAVGRTGFESFWTHYDQMDRATRRTAGRAIVRLLPDATARLGRRLASGPIEQRLKALQVASELDLVETLKAQVLPLCAHPSPRVRSKAVTVLGQIGAAAIDPLLERVVRDEDPRVRANAVEAMERRPAGTRFVPLLAERAREGANRERANAIKALHSMKVGVAASQLLHMLRDARPEHRVSALWALRRIGWWRMLSEVARLAREDDSLKVRQYALAVLQTAAVEAKPTPTRLAG